MLSNFFEIKKNIDANKLITKNEKIGKYLKDFNFIHIDNQLIFDSSQEIYQNLRESKAIAINKVDDSNQSNEEFFFIIVFKLTVIIVKSTSLFLLYDLFKYTNELNILFLSNSKEEFIMRINIKFHEYNLMSDFKEEIGNFERKLEFQRAKSSINKLWNIIKSCISGYLINESYSKLNNDRMKNFFNSKEQLIALTDDNDLIELRNAGKGSKFKVDLFYHIGYKKLIVIKKPMIINDPEIKNLLEREEKYLKIIHPFIAKFYWISKNKNSVATEYINGKTLLNIEEMNLNETEKITIIFQLMIVIEFIHRNNLIYRDLKPDNVMIDQNKTAVLIDFDRMIDENSIQNKYSITADFNAFFSAPEFNFYECSKKSDIYSLGQMINYVMNGNQKSIDKLNSLNFDEKYWGMKYLYEKCIKENPADRPDIQEIILEFYVFYRLQIHIECLNKLYDPDTCSFINNLCVKNSTMHQFTILGLLYYSNIGIKLDINKSIYYWSLGAKQNDPQSYFYLGIVFLNGKHIKPNAQKALSYFSIAADMNNCKAQQILGQFYYEGRFVSFDLDKAIYYYSRAADQNDCESQYELSLIYSDSKLKDMDKAIHYLTLSADQNHALACYNLGVYYYEGEILKQNINKAMHYFEIGANQNDPKSQHYLGAIYVEGKYVQRNISKALKLLLLSANQNYMEAQFVLGQVYYSDQFVARDISKAIYYFTLAAKQNHAHACYYLGYIYSTGYLIRVDKEKGIFYYTKAADLNEPRSQLTLGKCYLYGIGVKIDVSKAIYFFSLAAKQNCTVSQYILFNIYLNDELIPRNISKAIYYGQLAAKNDDLRAQISLGYIYYQGKYVPRDIKQSFYYFSMGAKKNDAESQFCLGMIYQDDKSEYYNIDKALYYLSLSANQNYLFAQKELFNLYNEGKKIPRDINKAINYCMLAANKNNNRNAQYILGTFYHLRYDVPRDISRAIYYYTLASNQNHLSAQINLSGIYYEGKYVKQDINKAIYYCTLAANQNSNIAQYNLGLIYFNNQEINKAIYYFEISAKQGNAEAQYVLGFLYLQGKYIKRNTNKAIEFFSQAVKKNHPFALYALGIIFIEGLYIECDLKKGMDMLTKSAELGNVRANFALGYMYHECLFTQHDIQKSIHYYKYASSFNDKYAKNNLGIIYKNGYKNKIEKNIGLAIEYFKEAIRLKNDYLSMFNLALIYIFNDEIVKDLNKAIDLLVESYNKGFQFSLQLLSLILLKDSQYNINNLKCKIEKNIKIPYLLQTLILKEINEYHFYISDICDTMLEFYKNTDFLYNYNLIFIMKSDSQSITINNLESFINKRNIYMAKKVVDISSEFYEGFGIDINEI